MLDGLFQDLRYAFRALRKDPAFAAVAILSLSLGIGANTAIFSLINALTLKSLPVTHPEELVQVMMGKQSYMGFTNPTWEHLRDRQDVFSGVFAYGRWGLNLSAGGQAHSVHGNYVSGAYFETLGVRALLGRTLTPADDKRGCTGSAVLSYGFWQSEYGGRTDVVGKPISIDRHPIEVVGVTEPGFNGTEVGGSADIMLPLCSIAAVGSGRPGMLDINFYPVGWLQVMGRLKHGMSPAHATVRLKTLAPQIYKSALDQNGLGREDGRQLRPESRDEYVRRTFDIEPAGNGISYLRRQYAMALNVLMTIVCMVLLIACANVANLLLARGASRQREIAIRLAIGVSRGRLIRQLLTESLLLSGLGAALGVLFAEWGVRLLVRFLDAPLEIDLDVRVLTFTAGAAVLSGLLFGVAPAWQGTRVDPQSALKAHSRRVTVGSKLGLGKMLVMAQLALSFLVIVGAGLMLSTFWNLISLDAGFERNHVLLVNVDLRGGNYPAERWSAVYQQMLDQLRSIPGVRSASVSSIAPVCHCRWAGEVVVEGYTPKSHEDALVSFNNISDRYFETIGTQVLAGRDFNRLDTDTSAKVAIVSQSMARKYFGATNPLGHHFRLNDGDVPSAPVEVIGVVKDAKYGSLSDEPTPFAFIPWSQGGAPGPLTGFELRTVNGSPTGLIPGVKSAIARVNPAVAIEFQTLARKVDDSIQRETLLAALSSFFGVLALLLATIGLYGVMSYNITRRRNEIGIRLALGAQRFGVLRMILREVVILIAAGLLVGLSTALATTRMLAGFIYGIQPHNPWTLGMAAGALATVAAIAGYLPARRASRLDPMDALREE